MAAWKAGFRTYPRFVERPALPIDGALCDVVAAVRERRVVVVVAPPGAGKTTRIPVALLEAGCLGTGALWVLQPRRVATRAAARRIAAELGEPVGRTAGYLTRDESVASPSTRILVVTEGILTRRLLADPSLPGIAAVMLDELHERSRHADLALAMLREVRETLRGDLAVLASSATLDPDPVARFLGSSARPAPVVRVESRGFPVDVRYDPLPDGRPLAARVATAVRGLLSELPEGDVLVFLPGAGDIRASLEALSAGERRGLLLAPLHGDLPGSQQDAALAPAPRGTRKVVLATNVAETSLTIEGVRAVVDSGLAKVLRFDPRSGLDRLELSRVSRASAEQRAGRAGRTGPGLALRLFTKAEERALAPFEEPEIARTDVAGTLLDVLLWTARDPERFGWFEAPPPALLRRGLDLLRRLGAVERDGFAPTALGRRMAALPLHPRLAAVVVAGADAGLAREAALLASLLEERDVLRSARAFGDETAPELPTGSSDLLLRYDLVGEAERGGDRRDLEPGATGAVLRLRDRLARAAAARGGGAAAAPSEAELLRLLLAGFPDRVARRRARGSAEAVLSGPRAVVLDGRSVVRDAPLFLVLETSGAARDGRERVRLASAVEPGWLADVPGGGLEERTALSWDDERELVVARRQTLFDGLVLDEREVPAPLDEATASLLAAKASADLPRALDLGGAVASLRERLSFLAAALPERGIPALHDDELGALLPDLCRGRRRLAELRGVPLLPVLKGRLGPRLLALLDREAPETLPVPTGRRVPLRYAAGKPPVLAVKLQELFGLAETPRVAEGRVKVVLELLSPAGRPVQVTDDLAGFWNGTYQLVRRELRGRYPKHPWPEDPWTAPPQRGTRRRGVAPGARED